MVKIKSKPKSAMAAELEAEPRTVLVHFKQHARPVSFLVAEPNKYAKTHALVKAAITTTFRSSATGPDTLRLLSSSQG